MASSFLNPRRCVFALSTLALTAAHAAPLPPPYTYRFDFGPDPQANVQPGFMPINMPNGLIAKAYNIPGGQLTLSTSSSNAGVADSMLRLTGVDRGVPPGPANAGAFTYSNLLRDFIAATNTANSQPSFTMVVNGFTNNTRYRATFWSYDPAAPAQNDEKSEWFINGKSFTTYSYNTSLPPRSNTDGRVSFSTTFDVGPKDADRRFVFTGKYISGPQVSVLLNGAEFIPIAPLPETADWLMMLCGLPLVEWILRKRSLQNQSHQGIYHMA